MYDICGMSNTVQCMLPCTVLCMCSVVCTHCTCEHLVSFGYVYVMMQLCIICCMYLYMNEWCIHTYACVGSDSHSGLEGDHMVGKICIIM